MARVRIATISYCAKQVRTFKDFAVHIRNMMDRCVAYRPDFVVFPEILTTELMNMFPDEKDFTRLMDEVDAHTEAYMELFRYMAVEYGCYIVGGTHLIKIRDKRYNSAQLFAPNGIIHKQRKLHPIPQEKAFITPGDRLVIFDTPKCKVAITTCYDVEFPVVARLARMNGAKILLVPSATLDLAGYWRVRYCAHARCIENTVYAAVSSFIGTGMPGMTFTGGACILSPCDRGFPSDGVIADYTMFGQEEVVFAEVDTDLLDECMVNGSVRPFHDRRKDLLVDLYDLEHHEIIEKV